MLLILRVTFSLSVDIFHFFFSLPVLSILFPGRDP